MRLAEGTAFEPVKQGPTRLFDFESSAFDHQPNLLPSASPARSGSAPDVEGRAVPWLEGRLVGVSGCPEGRVGVKLGPGEPEGLMRGKRCAIGVFRVEAPAVAFDVHSHERHRGHVLQDN